MPIPAVIKTLLSQNNIAFSATETLSRPELCCDVRSTIFQDGDKKLQVIFRADSILDVAVLCQLTQRQLKVATPASLQTICDKLNLDHITSVPKILEIDLIVDPRLFDLASLTFDSGSKDALVTITQQQFQILIGDATIGAFTVLESALEKSSLDAVNDVEQITAAIANFTQLRIKEKLEDTLELPPLPETAQRIIRLRANPDADINDLIDIVENDPPLAAQVVSWAASPYYAAPGKIQSVHDAIVRVLGFDLLLNLALGLALGKTLSPPKSTASGFHSYWEEAVYAATAVEALAGAIPAIERPPMGLAYLSGLLHNFGDLILAEVFPADFATICHYQEANPYSNHRHIEHHLLGVNRDQLGAWIMRLWNMPEAVCTALRFQNDADFDNENSSYANLLFIAMRLLRKHGVNGAPLTEIPPELYQRLHLDPEKADEAIMNMLESSDELQLMASNLAA